MADFKSDMEMIGKHIATWLRNSRIVAPEFRPADCEVDKKVDVVSLRHRLRDSHFNVDVFNGRPYITDSKGNEYTACALIHAEEYELAAKFIEEEKHRSAILTMAELLRLREQQTKLMKELCLGLAQKVRKTVNVQELKYKVASNKTLEGDWSAETNIGKKL